MPPGKVHMMLRLLFPLSVALAIVPLQAQTKSPSTSKARLSNEASDMLNATGEARAGIQARDKQDAIFHIDHALALATVLVASNRQFISLYDEWENYSVIGPLMRNRNVQDASAAYTSVALNAQADKTQLEAAQQAVNKGQFQKADAALAAIQDGVVVTTVAGDLPLLRARENMVLARRASDREHYNEAHAALQASTNALSEYANGQGPHSADALALRSEIDTYNQNIEQTHADASTKIEEWWDRMTDWVEMPNEAKRG